MSLEVGLEEEVDGRTFFLYDGETADEEYLVGRNALDGAGGPETQHVEVILVCCSAGCVE